MNEIKSTAVQSLTVGDIFSYNGNGPYVATLVRTFPRSEGGGTVVECRHFANGLPRGNGMRFATTSLSTVLVMDRFYGSELYS